MKEKIKHVEQAVAEALELPAASDAQSAAQIAKRFGIDCDMVTMRLSAARRARTVRAMRDTKPIIVEVGPVGVPVAIDIIPPRPADRDQRALIVLGEAFRDDGGQWRFRQDARPWNYLWSHEARDLASALMAAADEAEEVGS